MLGSSPLLAEASSNLAARYQMAFTLGFHIIPACFGVAFPAMMPIAEYRGGSTGRRRPAAGEALVEGGRGAVRRRRRQRHGALIRLGLLWPEMMDRFGDAFGVGFAIEGIFFFLEAIFIAIYIYGWDRSAGWAHFWSGIPIVISGPAAPRR